MALSPPGRGAPERISGRGRAAAGDGSGDEGGPAGHGSESGTTGGSLLGHHRIGWGGWVREIESTAIADFNSAVLGPLWHLDELSARRSLQVKETVCRRHRRRC